MSSVVHIRRINENGIKKMCRNIFSVQQQLTNITMTRELALDQARQYYEMLCNTPDVSLNVWPLEDRAIIGYLESVFLTGFFIYQY